MAAVRPRTRETAALSVGADALLDLGARLKRHYGPQSWWPAGAELEMIFGAILVQNTAWTNARRALDNLSAAGLLDAAALLAADDVRIAELIRPSGYFNSKTGKLKAFARMLMEQAEGDLPALLARPLDQLRPLLLSTHGIGPETADAICLYAARLPTVVVDAYTRRILGRLGWLEPGRSYAALRSALLDRLPPQTAFQAEYHALLVTHAKRTCTKRPRCLECPLLALCPTGASEIAVRPVPLSPAPHDWSA